MDVSKNSGFSPQIIHFNGGFHYKPSILGYLYFRKHPYENDPIPIFTSFFFVKKLRVGHATLVDGFDEDLGPMGSHM